jgi:hypothetical protein
MPKVYVSIPKLAVKSGGDQEIYVVALACDQRGEDAGRIPNLFINATNETLPNISPDLINTPLMKWMCVSVSNIFSPVSPSQPVSLSGRGIVLYPGLDPKGLLALHFVVVECDSDHRDVGRLLANLSGDDAVNNAIGSLTADSVFPIAALMNTTIGVVSNLLRGNGDDLYLTHNHSGTDSDWYGHFNDGMYEDYEIENNKVRCTLRIQYEE